MNLVIQIKSICVSFLFGIGLSFLINVNYSFLFSGKKIVKIIGNLLFSFDMALLYFICIKKINQGIIHPYFYILILAGFLLTFSKTVKVRKWFKLQEVEDSPKSKKLPKSVKNKEI